ncbi:MAG: winged helix-turn-helix domain-containing protein [Candidatus Micrarchaeia archaeon]
MTHVDIDDFAVDPEIKELTDVSAEFKKNILKLKDPTVMSSLVHKALSERKRTNMLLERISKQLAKIDDIERRLAALEEKFGVKSRGRIILSDIDEKIVDIIRKADRVCAEDIQKAFNYRGKNAASARLNSLYQMGLLDKQQVGKKVYYFLRDNEASRYEVEEMIRR